MDALREDLLSQTRLLVEETRWLRRQAEDERARSALIRLDIRTQVAISRERRARGAKLLAEVPPDS